MFCVIVCQDISLPNIVLVLGNGDKFEEAERNDKNLGQGSQIRYKVNLEMLKKKKKANARLLRNY